MKYHLAILICFLLYISYTYADNKSHIDSLKNCLKNEIDESQKMHIYIDLAALYSLSDPEVAREYAGKAYEIGTKIKDHSARANAINNFAVSYYYQGKYEKALDYYSKALKIDQSNNNRENIATRLSNIGMVHADLGNYDKAIENYQQALIIDEELGNKENIAVRLNNIAMIYTVRGRFESAIENFQKALEIDKELNNQEFISIRLNNIGMIFLYMEKYIDAIDYFNQALEIDRNVGNNQNIAIRLNNLGRANSALKNYKEALDLYNKALKINKEISNQGDIAIGLKNIGETYLKTEEYKKAEDLLLESLTINDKLGKLSEVCNVRYLLGKLYFIQGNIQLSIQNFHKSIEISQKLNMLPATIENYFMLYKVYSKTENSDSSLYYYENYIHLNDSVFNENINQKLSLVQAKYETEKKEKEIAVLNKDKAIKQAQINKQRTFIYLIIFLFILLIISFLMLYAFKRNKDLKTKNQLKEELNLYMQKALRQQMNPHFIFNTLTSIQYFILENNNISSNKYLSKFAKLMRITLDNSQHNTVSVEEELETIRLYLELESLRFEEKFDYEINLEKKDILDYQIPTLLIQPFVENSIWHGIMNKKIKGKIKIDFYINQKNLICKIEDNGIGREKAKEIKSKKVNTHQSLGTKITKTRLELINTLYKNNMNIIYTDLKDEQGNATGTRVEINVPLIS